MIEVAICTLPRTSTDLCNFNCVIESKGRVQNEGRGGRSTTERRPRLDSKTYSWHVRRMSGRGLAAVRDIAPFPYRFLTARCCSDGACNR
jgi:hypothetical protein